MLPTDPRDKLRDEYEHRVCHGSLNEILFGDLISCAKNPMMFQCVSVTKKNMKDRGVTWPDRGSFVWRLIRGDTLVWCLVARVYYLQQIAFKSGENVSRYWASLYLDQHYPFIAWLTQNRRGPTLEEYHAHRLDPMLHVPICGENINAVYQRQMSDSVFGPSNVVSKSRGKRRSHLDKFCWKAVPIKCLKRGQAKNNLKIIRKHRDAANILMCTWLGNYRHCRVRMPLAQRLKFLGMTHEDIWRMGQKRKHDTEMAPAEFMVEHLPKDIPYSKVMKTKLGYALWHQFWKSVQVVSDDCIRQSIISGSDVSDQKYIGAQKRAGRKPMPKQKRSAMMVVSDAIMTASSKRTKPKPRFAETCMLYLTQRDYIPVFRHTPELRKESIDFICNLIRNCTPQKTVPARIKNGLDVEQVNIMASIVTSLNQTTSAILVPLPLQVYEEHTRRGYQEKMFFICPVCCSTDFVIAGLAKRSKCVFKIDGRRGYIRVCPVCSDGFSVPVVHFDLAGRLLLLDRQPVLLCTFCGDICAASYGSIYKNTMFFQCKKCCAKSGAD